MDNSEKLEFATIEFTRVTFLGTGNSCSEQIDEEVANEMHDIIGTDTQVVKK